jgi:hypothetical protein
MDASSYKNVAALDRHEYGSLGIVGRRIRHPKKQRLAEIVDDLADHFRRLC